MSLILPANKCRDILFLLGVGGHILETCENWGEKRTVRKEDKENILDRDTEKDTNDRE